MTPGNPSRKRSSDVISSLTDSLTGRHFRWLTLTPAAILMIVLTVYPVINLFSMAVATIRFEQATEIWLWTPWDNFRQLMQDRIFLIALWNTFVFAIASVSLELVFGFALAVIVSSFTAWKGIVRSVLILPILMPAIAIGSMWRFNQFLTSVGLGPVNWLGSTSLALWSIVIVDVWHWTPFVFLVLLAAVEGLPKDIMEAARMDGASNRVIVFQIILPLLKPVLAVAALFRVIMAFKMFDQVFLLTSGGPGTSTEMVSLYLYKVLFQQNQLGYGAMLSLTIIAATIALLLVGKKLGSALLRP